MFMLSVDEAPFLGERAVQRLLECPRLQLVAHLNTWGPLSSEQLEQLQAQVDDSNLDVCLVGSIP